MCVRCTCPGLQGFQWRLASDPGAAARSEAESMKRSAAPQPATAATRSPQPPPRPPPERSRAGRPTHHLTGDCWKLPRCCHTRRGRPIPPRSRGGLGIGLWVEWVNTKAQLADTLSRIQGWRTNGGPGHEHEQAFSDLITDIRPIVLPAEREWPDQLAFLDQTRGCN